MSDFDRDGGDVPASEHEGNPELDVDTAFAAIVARLTSPDGDVDGEHPWPDAENLSPEPGSRGEDPRAGGPDGPRSLDLRDVPGAPAAPPRPATDGNDRAGRGAGTLDPQDTYPAVGRHVASGADVGTPWYGEDDDRFIPPDPPPLPRGDLISRLAWAGVVCGPLFLLLAALFWPTLPKTLLLLALAAFVGGFVTLVARMPGDHPEDEDDDGAVV